MNTLKVGKDFDETTRVHMYLAGWLAKNADGSIYLTRSNGRRRSGRQSFYYLHQPKKIFAKRFMAENDDEALEMANWYAKGLEVEA